jgi:hypothetical protein
MTGPEMLVLRAMVLVLTTLATQELALVSQVVMVHQPVVMATTLVLRILA